MGRKPLSDDERIMMALARFGEGGRTVSVRQLAKRFNRHPSVVSRAVSEAIAAGLVEVRRAPRARKTVVRDEWAEQRILDRFPELQVAIVVDAAHRHGDSDDIGDVVHEHLGMALAEFIAGGTVFRSGDSIGIGSGRGVYATATALAQFQPLRVTDVRLVSLTGDAYATHHLRQGQGAGNLLLEADDHVNLFAKCFAPSIPVRLVRLSARIAYEDDETMRAVRGTTWLGAAGPPAFSLSHALIGVGALTRGHRFFEEVKGPFVNAEPGEGLPTSLKDGLVRLVGLSDRLRERHSDYLPVADVCNSLFLVERDDVSEDLVRDLRECIREINDKLLNIKPDYLKRVPFLILVAGTSHKASAIRQLLADHNYHVRVLCTDKSTARTLLEDGKT